MNGWGWRCGWGWGYLKQLGPSALLILCPSFSLILGLVLALIFVLFTWFSHTNNHLTSPPLLYFAFTFIVGLLEKAEINFSSTISSRLSRSFFRLVWSSIDNQVGFISWTIDSILEWERSMYYSRSKNGRLRILRMSEKLSQASKVTCCCWRPSQNTWAHEKEKEHLLLEHKQL